MSISFSVIIPTYNRLDLLRSTLESIPESGEDIEIIVIDDGSTDGTWEYLRTRSDIISIQQKNSGPGAARNRGIEAASNSYIAFLDSDDLWFPWSLQFYRTVIESSKAKVIFGCPLKFTDEFNEAICSEPPSAPHWNVFSDYFSSGDVWRWWSASSFVIHRDTVGNARFLETPVNGEDADFILQLGHENSLAQVVETPTFGYREHAGSIMLNSEKTVSGARTMLDKELSNQYPGGATRAPERRRIIMRHLRPVILNMMKQGDPAQGWEFFRKSFKWHLQQKRLKFILGVLALRLKSND